MTTHKQTILVLGATGKTGSRLVRTLRAQGRSVRAASRSGEFRFDWFDEDTWQAALDGVTAVYLMVPDDPAPVPVFVRRATEAGVGRFVVLSGRGMGQLPPELFQGMAAAERAVRGSGARWSIIRPNNFNQNFEDVWLPQLRSGRLALPTGGVGDPFIDAQDIADVAAVLLTSEGHHGRVYDLTGPRVLTFGAAVAAMAEAAGRTIVYEEITPERYQEELREGGVPEEVARELGTMFEVLRTGLHTGTTDAVRTLLGREPVDFGTYAARTGATGIWS
ncbi:NmrA family NAD(P)-binding protein [Streptomyces yaizuensis]|uniref:NAD(P)H-binding protein n=1 Tax=Streptomyces yaizuensis TaxID=2989713 RepID=A0ABQ5NS88_9ACTN|nr:NAD(P)H-binding protein [Streptomyces sp. YSPA8]GLF93210.1 NAD(P)H-binding protein [Streptomyces sp. YSPA8]